MRFWKRSIRQDDRSHRDFTRARGPSRKRRLQLENLEERTLLSTYTLSEFRSLREFRLFSETVNNITTDYFNPPSPFVVNTGSGSNTVNILDTSAGIAITVNRLRQRHGQRGQRRQRAGHPRRPDHPEPAQLHDTINVNDSADTAARTVTLSTFSSGGVTCGSITGLAPAAINYKYADTSSVSVTTGSAADTVNVLATGVATNLSTSGGRRHGQRGQRRQRPGHPRPPDHPEPARLHTINVDDSADTVGADRDAEHVQPRAARPGARSPAWPRPRSATSTPTPAA